MELKEAAALIEQERQARVKAATEELNELLEKHGVSLLVHQEIVNGQPGPTKIMVVAQ
jgi:nucleotide-binding universal stress UspA family protein